MSKTVPNKVPVWCRLFPDEKEALKRLAVLKRRKMAEIVRESILIYLEKEAQTASEPMDLL